MGELATAAGQEIVIEIGGMPVLVRTESAEFHDMLEGRYAGFVNPAANPVFEFDVELVPPVKSPTKMMCWCAASQDAGSSSVATSAPSGTRHRAAVILCNRPTRIPSTPLCGSFTV